MVPMGAFSPVPRAKKTMMSEQAPAAAPALTAPPRLPPKNRLRWRGPSSEVDIGRARVEEMVRPKLQRMKSEENIVEMERM